MNDASKTTAACACVVAFLAFVTPALADCERGMDTVNGAATLTCSRGDRPSSEDRKWISEMLDRAVPPNFVSGSWSTVIGCGVTVSGGYEIGYGIGKTMAILYMESGTWAIDWPEVSRVAALDYQYYPACQSPTVVSIARALQGARGKVKEVSP